MWALHSGLLPGRKGELLKVADKFCSADEPINWPGAGGDSPYTNFYFATRTVSESTPSYEVGTPYGKSWIRHWIGLPQVTLVAQIVRITQYIKFNTTEDTFLLNCRRTDQMDVTLIVKFRASYDDAY